MRERTSRSRKKQRREKAKNPCGWSIMGSERQGEKRIGWLQGR